MTKKTKILISLPNSLLNEADAFAKAGNISRSELVREAISCYLDDKHKQLIRDKMIKGYKEMAKINLELAEMCFEADNQTINSYEEKLAECE